jgi:hypothetical protein
MRGDVAVDEASTGLAPPAVDWQPPPDAELLTVIVGEGSLPCPAVRVDGPPKPEGLLWVRLFRGGKRADERRWSKPIVIVEGEIVGHRRAA